MSENVNRKAELRTALRDLRIELSLNTYRVAGLTRLNDSDLSVLDTLTREGTQSPATLARRTGIHAATMTGVLARLEKAGWIVRRPDPVDRRAVQIESAGIARLTEIYRGGNRRLDEIAEGFTEEESAIVLRYLRAAAGAIRASSDELATGNDH